MSTQIIDQITTLKNNPMISMIPKASDFLNGLLDIVKRLDGFGASLMSAAGKITEQKTIIQASIIDKVKSGIQGIKDKSDAASAAAVEKVMQEQAALVGGGNRIGMPFTKRVQRNRGHHRTMRKK
jgi:hypothetical protein